MTLELPSGVEAAQSARTPVDDFASAFASFSDLLSGRVDDETIFLVGHDDGRNRSEWTVGRWRNAAFLGGRQLIRDGVLPGDRVAVPAVNADEALLAMFACWCAHACCVPLDVAERAVADWPQEARAADCQFLIGTGKNPLGDSAPEQFTDTLQCIELDFASGSDDVLPPCPQAAELKKLDAVCLYSSGTTGQPKGVNLTYDNLLVNLDSMVAAFGWSAADRVLTVLPISHGNGLLIGSLLPWACGSSVVLCDRFRTEAFWSIARDEGVTVSSVVPTILAYLDARAGSVWPEFFREFVSGSGPLSRSLAERISGRGPAVRQLYGLSETTAVATMTPAGSVLSDLHRTAPLQHLVSVGPCVPHVEMTVLDDAGRPQPEGAIGELCVRGAVILRGYQDGTEPDWPWLRTGDEGCWRIGPDGERWFYVTGRLKDLIIRGGLNISPLEVEEAMLRHPRVDQVMAFGTPDEALGEAVSIAVVSKAGVSSDELHRHAARHLDRAKRPTRIAFVAEIPRTRTGKTRRAGFASALRTDDVVRDSGI